MLTVNDVCELLKVHRNHVYKWLSSGELRGIKLGGDRTGWRVRESDLQAFLERQERAS